jgi:hypothetical protein
MNGITVHLNTIDEPARLDCVIFSATALGVGFYLNGESNAPDCTCNCRDAGPPRGKLIRPESRRGHDGDDTVGADGRN